MFCSLLLKFDKEAKKKVILGLFVLLNCLARFVLQYKALVDILVTYSKR